MTRHVNLAATDLIQSYEKCKLVAYKPTPKDRWTIGWGSTFKIGGQPVKQGDVWTHATADAVFAHFLDQTADAVETMIGAAPTTDNQFGAMVSLAYNIGTGHDGFDGSTVRRKHVARGYEAAADAFHLWDKQAGVVLKGLVFRRIAEAALYRRP